MDNDLVKGFKRAQDSLVVQHSDFSLSAISDMVSAGSIDVNPHYQRRERWSEGKQSRLIESFILNVPVPPVYLSEDDYGTYSVIDGKQRISAIRDFMSGSLQLREVEGLTDLNGRTFSDLPPQIRNALSVRPYIRVITLLRQSDPSLKYEVFLRLNTGGEALLPQEIRNVAYSGSLNDLLFALSGNQFLRERLKITGDNSPAFRNMDDVEYVLRFFTLDERWENIGQNLSREMDGFMGQNRALEESKLRSLKRKFQRAISACQAIWGEYAFCKPIDGGWRRQFIAPIFDSQMVAVSSLSDSVIQKVIDERRAVIREFRMLFEGGHSYVKAVSQATNNPANVKARIMKVRQIYLHAAGK